MEVYDYSLVRASETGLEERVLPLPRNRAALPPFQAQRMKDNNFAVLYLSSMGVSLPFKYAFQELQRADAKYWLFRRTRDSEMQMVVRKMSVSQLVPRLSMRG